MKKKSGAVVVKDRGRGRSLQVVYDKNTSGVMPERSQKKLS